MLMKENIKIFLIALILGMVVAFFLSYKFKEPIAYALNPEATILYVGSYNNIDIATSKQRNYPSSSSSYSRYPVHPYSTSDSTDG